MNKAVLLLALLAACAPGSAPSDDACDRAAAHLAACGLSTAASTAGCDADAAQAIVGLSCDALTAARDGSDGKADLLGGAFGALACAAGVVRFCPAPACEAPAWPGPSAICADYIAIPGCGGCQYYACREAAHACGPSGYYLGFAEKYCTRFLEALRPRMSPAGQRFLDEGRDCLMQYVEDEIATDEDCATVKERAFASHVACYHDHGFCALPVRDRWLLVNTVDPADVDWITALRTGLSCL